MQTIQADISVGIEDFSICEKGEFFGYNIDHMSGLQVCFDAIVCLEEKHKWCKYSQAKMGRVTHIKMPVEIFIGKNEGDQVEFAVNGTKIIAKCSQTKYKFRSSNFSQALLIASESFGGVSSSKIFSSRVRKFTQYAMLIAIHTRLSRSMKMPTSEPHKFRYATGYISQCKKQLSLPPGRSSYEKDIDKSE